MTETEINSWINLGMDIGAHTTSHVDLTAISEIEMKKEMIDCKKQLENKYNVEVNDFCYPFGRFNELICQTTKKIGYCSATTMVRGRANSQSNIYALPRIPINHRTLPHLFLAKLLTNYEDRRHSEE